jgi:hypothetical protein
MVYKRRKYLIFGGIHGIGGFQLYTAARYQHVKNLGYETFVIGSEGQPNDVKLKDLKSDHCFSLGELCIPPYCCRTSQINHLSEKVKKIVSYKEGDEIFIEACSLPYALWGEIFSKSMNGVCFAYILSSHTENIPRDIQKYCSFKYDNELIAGQTDITLPDLFKGFRDIADDKRGLQASWSSPICDSREDCVNYISAIRDYKTKSYKIIGYFGTLNKPHFIKICEQIEDYARTHSNGKILFLTVGSSQSGKSEKRQLLVNKNTTNCDVLNIPELYPVPITVFSLMDVCLASWGSAGLASYGCDRVVRLLDDVDVVPQGIIGVTLREKPYYKQPVGNESLFEILDNVLFGDNYCGTTKIPFVYVDKSEERHNQIDAFLRPFTYNIKEFKYYDINSIKIASSSKRILSFCCHIIGINATLKMRFIAKKIQTIL